MNNQDETNSKKVSVIIPVYNKEEYLQECLDSVINQTIYPDMEIICINDGSTDSSLDILKKNQSCYDNIIILDQKNSGVGFSRNRGILSASGEFIAFMDADDYYIFNSTLETLYDKAKEHGARICGGSFCKDHGTWVQIKWESTSRIGKYHTFDREGFLNYSECQIDNGYTRFIYDRRMLVDNELFFPEYIRFEDPPFFVKAMACASRFYVVPEITYCYRLGYQEINWNEKRTSHLIMGLIDNLRFSKENDLIDLHKMTVWRFVHQCKKYIVPHLSSPLILALLAEAQQLVCQEWIIDDDQLTIGPIRIVAEEIHHFEACKTKLSAEKKNLIEKNSLLKDEIKELRKQVKELRKQVMKQEKENQCLLNSESYRLGKLILFIPRQIKRGIIRIKKQG